MDFLGYLGGAFVGGIILNAMPCVLPVLTLKVYHLIETVGDDEAEPKKHALAYLMGTTSVFLLFALVVVGLRSVGETIAWGKQFQYPHFIAGLVLVIFTFGLNALGVFEINFSMQQKRRSGLWGSYFNGVFAAVMSTPCTAPILVSAASVAMAIDTPHWQTLPILTIIGVGLALPFVLVSFVPQLAALLPRPGAWMETFKHLMGFTLLGTAVWLFGVLQAQVTPASANAFLWLLLFVGVGLWAAQRFASPGLSIGRRLGVRFAIAGVLVLVAGRFVGLEAAEPRAPVAQHEGSVVGGVENGHIAWQTFTAQGVKDAQASGKHVFMDYTAEWCAACKANESAFLETETVRAALQKTGVVAMKADMTNENAELEQWLSDLGRNAIPAYAIYMADGSVDLLPVAITAGLVADHLYSAVGLKP